MDPVRLNCYSAGNISSIYVFIGDVPKQVSNEIEKIKSGKQPNTKVLKSYYGSNFQKKLGLNLLKTGGSRSTPIDDPAIMSDIELIENFADDRFIEGGFIEGGSTEEEFNIDDIKNFLEEKTTDKPSLDETNVPVDNQSKLKLKYVDFSIYPDDKISEIKAKIYEATGYQPFKQHLFINEGSATKQLGYRFYVNNIEKKIRSLDIYKQKDHIGSVPIDSQIYENYEYVRVDAMDDFEVFADMSTNELNMIILDEFMLPGQLESYRKRPIINHGFLIIYFPMLTTPDDYISVELRDKYPDMYPGTKFIKQESQLMSDIESIEKKDWKSIQKKLGISVIYSVIKIMVHTDIDKKIIDIRQLFDKLELNENMKYVLCRVTHNGKTHLIEKSFKRGDAGGQLSVHKDYILIKYYPDTEKSQHLKIIIYQNSNYEIRAKWREENNYQINSIVKINMSEVNKLINLINSLNVSSVPIETMTTYNSVLSEIDLVISYEEKISPATFDNIKKYLQLFQQAGWITPKNDNEYYFLKGAYQHNINRLAKFFTLSNSYEFLTNMMIKNKYNALYRNTHSMKISHRTNDVYCEISGVKNAESRFILKYITYLFYLIDSTKVTYKKQAVSDRNIRGLKEQDPLLYDFKKIYNSSEVYSKICQKPFQPVIVTKAEYEAMNKAEKKKIVSYWNFTKNAPALYGCPDPKYPFIRFIVKKHPMGYCIPCCKKNKQPENAVTRACTTDHIYSSEVKNIIVSSRYITSYGRFLEIGRLSRLPENTLDIIFHGIYSTDLHKYDSGCPKTEGYYIYGVSQTLQNVNNIGILHCLANVFNLGYKELINRLIKLVGPEFQSEYSVDFIKSNLALLDTDSEVPEINWNELLMKLAKQYLGINFIIFEDMDKSEDMSGRNNIILRIPKYMKSHKTFVTGEFKNVVVICKQSKYNPIYLINEEIYFRTGLIESKTLTISSPGIQTIQQIVRKYLDTNQLDNKPNTYRNVTKFLETTKLGYKIISGFVDSGICFGLEISKSSNKHDSMFKSSFYFPIDYILWPNTTTPSKKFSVIGNCQDLVSFIIAYNAWILSTQSTGNSLATIKIDKLLKYNNEIVGLRSGLWNYYINPTPVSSIEKKISSISGDLSIIELKYDIQTMMQILSKPTTNRSESDSSGLPIAYYRTMLYPMIIYLIGKWLGKQKNVKLRNKIKINLLNISSKLNAETLGISDSDFSIINDLIFDFYKHKNRKLLLERFDNTQFEFDKLWLSEFKQDGIKISEQKKMVAGLMNEIAIKTTKQPKHIYNIYDGTGDYTGTVGKLKKIYISPDKWDTISDLVLQDLNNPLKVAILDKYTSITTDYFSFTQRPGEHIRILI